MSDRYTKSIRKKLSQLASIAYERELDQELEKLGQRFDNWRNRKIDGFELNDLIHKFHQGTSRDVWKTYNYLDADMVVSRAIVIGLLKKEEIPEDLLETIKSHIDFWKNRIKV